MASQYWKMLFNAAWQAELELDEHIAKLKAEYRISDDEIEILETLHKEFLLSSNSMVTQHIKEELKAEVDSKHDAAVRIACVVAIVAVSICGTIALAMVDWSFIAN